ncbi:Protein of unknown function [Roseivivax marinus]|uniref:DUF3775 domain-containing protein n=1 Tax=Roseivivax marinus TaxID=1379903 RepID=UPI0008C8B014|nr:DUF3775 domain-containing protein [Roseivivax marinus]SEL70197.1 Protein of unknown function [Roseivivax marinus]
MTSDSPRHPALTTTEDPLAKIDAPEATDVSEIELSIPLDTVCAIIDLAHDLMGKTASSGDDDEPDEEDVRLSVLEDRGDDPADLELRSVIHDLGIEARVDLVALMWLGRDGGDWAELRQIAEDERNGRTADYLCGTPHLADHLASGLDLLGRGCPA